MIRQFFRIFVRLIIRLKTYTVINATGLILAFSTFFLSGLYIIDELSYDKYHKKADLIYRIVEIYNKQGVGEHSSSVPFPLADTLIKDYPEVFIQRVRFFNFQLPHMLVQANNKAFNEKNFFFTDSNVFQLFDFELIIGNKDTVLAGKNKVVISEAAALKYFGTTDDIIGKKIILEEDIELTITGIMNNVSERSHFKPEFLASMQTLSTLMGRAMKNWIWNPCWTYIELNRNINKQQAEKLLEDFVKKHFDQENAKYLKLYLQPITDIHLKSRLDYEIQQNANQTYLYLIALAVIIILAVSIINFMNISIAGAFVRTKEISVKKIAGATNTNITIQLLAETIIILSIVIFISLSISELLLPLFSRITAKELSVQLLYNNKYTYIATAIIILITLIAQIYPITYLSRTKIKNNIKTTPNKSITPAKYRRALVVFQYTISIILLINTIVSIVQYNYLQNADLGFDKKNIIIVPVSNNQLLNSYREFKEELLKDTSVKSITLLRYMIGINFNTRSFTSKGFKNDIHNQAIPEMMVGYDFCKTFNIKLLAGRAFSDTIPNDNQKSIIINQSLANFLGCTNYNNAINKTFTIPYANQKIIGVVKDFNTNSLHSKITPLVIHMPRRPSNPENFANYIAIRISPIHQEQTIRKIEQIWQKYSPVRPFEYQYIEEKLNRLYKTEDVLVRLLAIFSTIALIISGLGIVGLTIFHTRQRTTEIGMRKILGASPYNIINLIVTDFFKMILLSNLFAWPLAYLLLKAWLHTFAYPVNIKIWMFALSAILAIIFAIIMVSYQTTKIIKSNPVKSLRYE